MLINAACPGFVVTDLNGSRGARTLSGHDPAQPAGC